MASVETGIPGLRCVENRITKITSFSCDFIQNGTLDYQLADMPTDTLSQEDPLTAEIRTTAYYIYNDMVDCHTQFGSFRAKAVYLKHIEKHVLNLCPQGFSFEEVMGRIYEEIDSLVEKGLSEGNPDEANIKAVFRAVISKIVEAHEEEQSADDADVEIVAEPYAQYQGLFLPFVYQNPEQIHRDDRGMKSQFFSKADLPEHLHATWDSFVDRLYGYTLLIAQNNPEIFSYDEVEKKGAIDALREQAQYEVGFYNDIYKALYDEIFDEAGELKPLYKELAGWDTIDWDRADCFYRLNAKEMSEEEKKEWIKLQFFENYLTAFLGGLTSHKAHHLNRYYGLEEKSTFISMADNILVRQADDARRIGVFFDKARYSEEELYNKWIDVYQQTLDAYESAAKELESHDNPDRRLLAKRDAILSNGNALIRAANEAKNDDNLADLTTVLKTATYCLDQKVQLMQSDNISTPLSRNPVLASAAEQSLKEFQPACRNLDREPKSSVAAIAMIGVGIIVGTLVVGAIVASLVFSAGLSAPIILAAGGAAVTAIGGGIVAHQVINAPKRTLINCAVEARAVNNDTSSYVKSDGLFSSISSFFSSKAKDTKMVSTNDTKVADDRIRISNIDDEVMPLLPDFRGGIAVH